MKQYVAVIRILPNNVAKWDQLNERRYPLVVGGRKGLVIHLDLAEAAMGGARPRPPSFDDSPCDATSEQECLRLFGFTCFSSEDCIEPRSESETALEPVASSV